MDLDLGLDVDLSNGLPALPVGMLPLGEPGIIPGQAPPMPPVQDAVPAAAQTVPQEPTRQQKAAATRAAKKAASPPDAS